MVSADMLRFTEMFALIKNKKYCMLIIENLAKSVNIKSKTEMTHIKKKTLMVFAFVSFTLPTYIFDITELYRI